VPNPTVAVLLHAADARACVADGARPGFAIRQHACVEELLVTLRTLDVALVVIDAAGADGRSMASAVASIRGGFPSVPVLAYCAVPSGRSDVLVDVVRAGATGLVLRGIDDARYAMRAAIASARRGSVAQRVHDEVALHLMPVARPLLRYAIGRAADEPSVEDAAASLGVDRKTLFNWLRGSGQVRPREFINWVRLAIVVGMLEDPGRSAEQAALEAGFSSGTAFRNMLQRYTGLRASEIRGEGAFETVLTRFLALLSMETDDDSTEPMPVSEAVIGAPAHHRGA
jgi:AraC-like DNA-binding protein